MRQELRQDIKALRNQMARLEEKCKEREDKLVKLIFALEPFLNALSPEMHEKILEVMKESESDL
jgi:predicted nuclease with TOPRIM domain